MTTYNFPDALIDAERTAWEAIQAGQLTVAQAAAVHDGVTAFATEGGHNRHQVEMALKRVVRHPAETA